MRIFAEVSCRGNVTGLSRTSRGSRHNGVWALANWKTKYSDGSFLSFYTSTLKDIFVRLLLFSCYSVLVRKVISVLVHENNTGAVRFAVGVDS